MAQATILHLSDLHFDSAGHDEVWKSLETYVNQTLKPDLIVVTGDIVDSPSRDSFQRARDSLERLQATHKRRYLVCAGNHDRHWRGNATGWATKLFSKLKRAQDAQPWFAEFFGAHLARLDQYEDIDLPAGTYNWKVRFAGIDSAISAKYLARGFIQPNDLQLMSGLSANAKDVDAVFLLMHHHLLPIASVERVVQGVADMVSGTTVVNAGTTLESLVNSQVNVVLHGHEHERNVARFGTFGPRQGETVVLGSGSSTGAVTLAPCNINKASSNVIELREDQSIWVKELRFSGGWGVRDAEGVCISPTIDVRKSKFYRITDRSSAPPTSEIIKHVRFTPQRDILFREARTDWLLKGKEFGFVSRNQTGVPVNPRVELELPANVSAPSKSINGFEPMSEPGAYVYKVALAGDPGPVLIPQIDIAYEWIDGALLTRRDLSLIPPAQRGIFREDGFEFVAISVLNDLRSFQLHAHLPDGFWPDPDGRVKVCVQHLGLNEPPRELPYLTEHLSTSGPGVLSLTVPYPWTGYRYCLAWQLPEGPPEDSAARNIRDAVRAKSAQLVKAFFDALQTHEWCSLLSVALYLPEEGQMGVPVAKRLAHIVGSSGVEQAPPEAVFIGGAQWVYRHAWWDGEGIGYSQETDVPDPQALEAGLLAGERWVFALPIHPLGARPGAYPVALLRIGVSAKISDFGLANPEAAEKFSAAWPAGMISLLYIAAQHV